MTICYRIVSYLNEMVQQVSTRNKKYCYIVARKMAKVHIMKQWEKTTILYFLFFIFLYCCKI